MRWLRLLAMVAVVAAAVAGARLLPLAGWATRLAEYTREAGAAGAAVFVLAYVGSAVAMLPGSPLTLAAGFAYGPVWGVVLVLPTSVVAATAAFLCGRTLLRARAARLAARLPMAQAIDRAVARDGFRLVFLLRLSPLVPFNLLNYVLSVSSVRLSDYVLASSVGMLPGVAIYVYLGSLASTAADLAAREGEPATLRLVVQGVGLVATVSVAVIAARLARRALSPELGPRP